MGHYISTIKIKNFKSCKDSFLELSPYTPLVGYNNAGKSNVLSAIQWLICRYNLENTDFNNIDIPVEIEAEICGITTQLLASLNAKHVASLTDYIDQEKIYILRVQERPKDTRSIKLKVWNFKENQYKDNPAGIDNAIKDIFPDPIRVGAMENAEEDASKAKTTTTIGKLLNELIQPLTSVYENDLNIHIDQISSQISCNGENRFSELDILDNNINHKINDLFPGISIKLHFETPTLEEILKKGTIQVYEDQKTNRNMNAYGHGAQRSIQIALIQQLAEIQRTKKDGKNTTLLLIDEPELYLHPFAIEQIKEALKLLSRNGYQVLFSTHSAQMIGAEDAPNTLLIRKSKFNGTYSRNRLKDSIQNLVDDSKHQEQHLFTLSHSSQILFSESALIAEGKTELRLLPKIIHKLHGRTLGQEKIALIPLGGVDNTKKTLSILKSMDIPCKAIVDLDFVFKGAINQQYISNIHPDIVAIKGIFTTLASTHNFCLDQAGFPKKGGSLNASQAYEVLAKEPSANIHIQNLHEIFKKQGIWVWTKGAIEPHLNIASTKKDEATWSHFNTQIDQLGITYLESLDYENLKKLAEWIVK